MVLFISNDLFFQPQVQQAAQTAGRPLVTRANLAAGLQWIQTDAAAKEPLQAVIVDLKTVTDSPTLLEFLSAAIALSGNESLTSIAYGPHVKVELLQSATDAGFQQVLTQGQFNRDVRSIMQKSI